MLHIYYELPPEKDRWIPGDRYVRPFIRRILRGRHRPGGVDKVYLNLCQGLDKMKIPYSKNSRISSIQKNDRVFVLGRGANILDKFRNGSPFVAGIGIFSHPSECADLTEKYPVLAYLSHSDWVNNLCKPWFGNLCKIWPAGIDTELHQPDINTPKDLDFIVYDKLHFNRDQEINRILNPVLEELNRKGLTYILLKNGTYKPEYYRYLKKRAKAFLFLSPHESQGIACQEAMASGLPVLAFDEGIIRDPYYIRLGSGNIQTSSVPWFSPICGVRFTNPESFPEKLEEFRQKLKAEQFDPRTFVVQHLSLEISVQKLLNILDEVYSSLQKNDS